MQTFLAGLGQLGFGALVVGIAAALVNYALGKRKDRVDTENVVITGFEKIVPASSEIIDQLREQIAYLFEQHRECAKDNKQLKDANAALTDRVVGLERTVARLERTTK